MTTKDILAGLKKKDLVQDHFIEPIEKNSILDKALVGFSSESSDLNVLCNGQQSYHKHNV